MKPLHLKSALSKTDLSKIIFTLGLTGILLSPLANSQDFSGNVTLTNAAACSFFSGSQSLDVTVDTTAINAANTSTHNFVVSFTSAIPTTCQFTADIAVDSSTNNVLTSITVNSTSTASRSLTVATTLNWVDTVKSAAGSTTPITITITPSAR